MSSAVQLCPGLPGSGGCGAQLVIATAQAPGSPHVATYASCPRCAFFNVERTDQHMAELAAAKELKK